MKYIKSTFKQSSIDIFKEFFWNKAILFYLPPVQGTFLAINMRNMINDKNLPIKIQKNFMNEYQKTEINHYSLLFCGLP